MPIERDVSDTALDPSRGRETTNRLAIHEYLPVGRSGADDGSPQFRLPRLNETPDADNFTGAHIERDIAEHA